MQPHTFHIPVMGTGFTIDTPIKVAQYGISSVVSLGDDKLIEKIRRYYCQLLCEVYTPIPESDKDRRARRITQYLDLMDRTVKQQIRVLKEQPFGEENDLARYFDLLDDRSFLKQKYLDMTVMKEGAGRSALEAWLKDAISPGSIDVNIMTKADRENALNGEKLPREYSDAMAALRGFAESGLSSSVVFSAGLNLHLYSYLAEFDDFYANEKGESKKKVILKVSDFRSALVQAKILAKKGIWISEYRIESGLNCGGHAFPTAGNLMGPILEEFKKRKRELSDTLMPIYREALLEKKRIPPAETPGIRVTAQGGVGTSAEHQFLRRYYEVDSVGWGSPFLLVPEATAVDDDTLRKLAAAGEGDIYLSHASPLGVPFYNLRNSSSNEARRRRIDSGKPGSPCLSKYLAFNTEYGAPLCTASSAYQQKKIEDLKNQGLDETAYTAEREKVLEKSCICRDLGDGALLKYHIADEKKEQTPAVCPGPNLAYFSRVCSLKEMVGHIYGKSIAINTAIPRPHFFINELKLYIDYLGDFISRSRHRPNQKDTDYCDEFKRNLLNGIEYYKALAEVIHEESQSAREKFVSDLTALRERLAGFAWPIPVQP